MLRNLLITVVGWSCCAHGAAGDFSQCLTELQEQARARDLSDLVVEQVIPALEQQQRVLELDRQQPEFVKTFGQYFSSRVSDTRVTKGRALFEQHREYLDQLSRRFGVPGRYLVAFWGLETNFGSYLGSMPTLDSLATLACDERRSGFFTEQLLIALQMLERDDLEPKSMRGSWAGAMGHTQFMPSTYANYAVDGDGDGHIDLWGSPRDALASGANYLKQLGWQPGVRWGREVMLPEDFDYATTGLDKPRKLSDWAGKGVTQANGDALPRSILRGAVLLPAGAGGPAFLVYANFHVIMAWNRSEFYALSVGHLADRIAGGGGLYRPPPADQQALSRDDVLAMQRNLAARGFDAGPADGILGPGTRRALSQFQKSVGLVPDGFPDTRTRDLLNEQ
jgi:membrane-bound lytic murein transglycosylase B